jgi:hypothetical protein
MSKKHFKPALPQARLETKAKSGGMAPVEWLRQHSLLVFLLLVAAASIRTVTTYAVFNHTIDEPAHIAWRA